MGRADVVDVLVNLVADHPDAGIPLEYGAEGLEFGRGIDGARRVGGRAEDEDLGAPRQGGLEGLGRELVAFGREGGHRDRDTARELGEFGVAHPVRGRHDDFIARVDEGQQGIGDAMLGAAGDHDARRGVVQAVFPRKLARHGLAEVIVAGDGRIKVVALVDRPLGRLAHGLGSREVRLSDGEVDYVDAGLAEPARP